MIGPRRRDGYQGIAAMFERVWTNAAEVGTLRSRRFFQTNGQVVRQARDCAGPMIVKQLNALWPVTSTQSLDQLGMFFAGSPARLGQRQLVRNVGLRQVPKSCDVIQDQAVW